MLIIQEKARLEREKKAIEKRNIIEENRVSESRIYYTQRRQCVFGASHRLKKFPGAKELVI